MDKRSPRPWLRLAPLLLTGLFALLALVPWPVWFKAKVDLAHSLALPSWEHLLGTDAVGRDLLVRIGQALSGAVLPLWLAVLAASIAGLGLSLGMLLLPSRARWLAQSCGAAAALLSSLPVYLVVFCWAAWLAKAGLWPVLSALALLVAARTYLELQDLYRGSRHLAYWEAHMALGGKLSDRLLRYGVASHWRLPLARTLAFHLQVAVVAEASLSYLGFGIQEPQASLGNMLAAHFELFLHGHWAILVATTLALALAAAVPRSLLQLWPRRPRPGQNQV